MEKSYLVVEATLLIKELKVFAVRFATPKVEVTNFEVTPNCKFHVLVFSYTFYKYMIWRWAWLTVASVVGVSTVV